MEHVRLRPAPAKESRWRRFLIACRRPAIWPSRFWCWRCWWRWRCWAGSWLPNWGSAASRLLGPLGVRALGRIGPNPAASRRADTDVLVGESVEIAAEIKNPGGKPHRGLLLVTARRRAESPLPMTADEKHQHYRLTVPSVLKPLKYRLEIGDSQTQVYAIGVRKSRWSRASR